MLASEIILQLSTMLPQKSDLFSDNSTALSVTRSGTTVTVVTTQPHGLSVGQGVNISGAETPLTIISFTRSGIVGTIVTSTDHDATKGVPENINVQGANESEFNGSFKVINVDNRRTIRVTMLDSGPTTATGSPIATNISNYFASYNGLFEVTTVPNTTTFTYEITNTTALDPVGTINVRANVRISGTVSEESIIDAYTKQDAPNELWGFVVLEDVVASRSRHIQSDAVDNIQRSNYFRQQVIQPFSFYVAVPTSSEIAGRSARDICETLFLFICQSILFKRFSSGLTLTEYSPLQFSSHGSFLYNKAYYVHRYSFEQMVYIQFDDTVGSDPDVAFRDIELDTTMNIGTGIEQITANINLDDIIL